MRKFGAFTLGWRKPLTYTLFDICYDRMHVYILLIADTKSKGVLMDIDIYSKSEQLLNQLANSLYDREPNKQNPVFFSIIEIQLVERFLKDVLNESKIQE